MNQKYFVLVFGIVAQLIVTACASGEKQPEFGKATSNSDEAHVVTQERVVQTVEKKQNIPVVRTSHMGADINKMNADNFATLGFPAPIAKNIVKYRDDHGDFKSVDDLQKVEGMDQNALSQIKPKLAVQQG